MPKKQLISPSIVICDDDDAKGGSLEKLTEDVQTALRDIGIASPFLRDLGFPTIQKCRSGKELSRTLSKAGKSVEICLIVTDSCGEIAIRDASTCAPYAKRLLYSTTATNDKVVALYNDGVIDRFIDKPQPPKFRQWVCNAYNSYWQTSVLRSMREYINLTCNDPSRPCFQDGRKWLSMIDIYSEVIRGTEVGQRLQDLWSEVDSIRRGAL